MPQSNVVRKVDLLLTSTLKTLVHHVKLHVGVGIGKIDLHRPGIRI